MTPTIFNLLMSVLCVGGMTACGSPGGGAVSALNTVPSIVSPSQPDLVIPPVNAPTVNLTVYTLSSTFIPTNLSFASQTWGNLHVTETGSCVNYLGAYYCWDNGLQTVARFTDGNNNYFGPYKYEMFQQCQGACNATNFGTPTFITPAVASNLPSGLVNNVFATGTPSAITCNVTSTQVTCPNFTLDLN